MSKLTKELKEQIKELDLVVSSNKEALMYVENKDIDSALEFIKELRTIKANSKHFKISFVEIITRLQSWIKKQFNPQTTQ